MQTVNMHEAKTHLSRLLEQALNGEEIIIARAGTPVARLVPYRGEIDVRRPGRMQGEIRIADNFDEPLDELFGL